MFQENQSSLRHQTQVLNTQYLNLRKYELRFVHKCLKPEINECVLTAATLSIEGSSEESVLLLLYLAMICSMLQPEKN